MRTGAAGRLCGAAVAAALIFSVRVVFGQGGWAGLALSAGSFLAGPVQALQAAASLAQAGAAGAAEAASTVAGWVLPPTGSMDGGTGDVPAAAAPSDTGLLTEAASYPLSGEAAPEGAGVVQETTYAQGSGGVYIPCGAGTIRNNTSVSAAQIQEDAAAGLPFAIQPGSSEPQVLILHTHATETYRTHAGLWYAPGDTSRSTDNATNMCAVGEVMARELNAAGIVTLHDTTLNDYPSYTGSYDNSRAVAQQYLAQYPSIQVIIDVHRDAIESDGVRMAPVCQVNGRQAAQVMLIAGCDNGTTVQLPNYRQNLRFAAAWEAAMEADYPGLTRPVLFSYRYYNQDLSPGALLIEVGGHGNSLDEALYAGQLAARSLARVLTGAAGAD